MPHQWMEGNLPVASKCTICDKTCGSVLRYQHCFHSFQYSFYNQVSSARKKTKILYKISQVGYKTGDACGAKPQCMLHAGLL